MAEPAKTDDVPKAPSSRFAEYMRAADKFRKENGVDDLTDEESMELALAEIRKSREERKARYSSDQQ